MRKTICLFLALLLCCSALPAPAEEEGLRKMGSGEMEFYIEYPAGLKAAYMDGGALTVYAQEKGYVPYVRVYRRDGQLSNPVNYLNNTYREYMEDSYNNQVATSPCKEFETGGKTLYMARYHYIANGNKLCLMLCIERREDGDVEYHAKYQEGREEDILSLLDTIVRTYSVWKDYNDVTPTGRVIYPLPAPDASGLTDGEYPVYLTDLSHIREDGYFTAVLCPEHRYSAEEIETLEPGDQVQVNGMLITVADLDIHEDEHEIMYGDGVPYTYVSFSPAGEGMYIVTVDDWSPCAEAARIRITLPLGDEPFFLEMPDGTAWDNAEFLEIFSEDGGDECFVPYNTYAIVKDGRVVQILSWPYPYGPEGDDPE